MAITYNNTPMLQKVQLNGATYYLKDAEARANFETLIGSHNLAALSDAAWRAITAQTIGDNDNLVTGAQVMDYVDSIIETIPEFDVVVVPQGQDLPTASADTFHKIYLKPDPGAISGNSYIEWITLRSGSEGSYTYTWEQIGSTEMDLSGYVTDVQYASGRKLQQKKGNGAYADIHTFGALADKDSGSVTTDAQSFTGLTASGTAAGSITVTIKDAASATSVDLTDKVAYTPAGSITATVDVSGNVTATQNNAGAFQVGGTVGGQTVYISPSAATVSKVKTAGTTPSFTGGTIGTFTPATITYAPSDAFAKSGVTCTVGTGADAECLIFSAAATGTASVISAFNGGSWAQGTFNAGAMPTFDDVSALSGVAATVSVPDFTGNKYDLSFSKSDIQLKNAAFQGTEAANLIPTKAAYYKQEINAATFTGGAITVTVEDFTVTSQTKTVSFS